MRVAVLAGGRSSEHEVSLSSGASVADGLRQAGHEVVEVVLGRDGDWRCDGEEVVLRPGRGLLGADAVFPVLHGPFGEDGTVQGLLELLDVPYVGSGVLASALCLDKVVFKDVMARAGIPQVAYAGLRGAPGQAPSGADLERVRALGFPCWVKPARLGSSVGIAPVDGPDELADALERAFEHDPHVIVEASAPGLEVECSVLGHTASPRTSEPGEIVLASAGWYDYAAKYEPGGMELAVPARISPAARERVQELARAAFARRGLQRPGPRRLLRRRRAGPAQRAQHDARLHADQRLREALGGQRPALPAARGPPRRAWRSSATPKSGRTRI